MTSIQLRCAGCALLAALLAGCGPASSGPDSVCAGRVPGDLVITELLPNPDGADTGKEFIELFNPTEVEVPLKGMTLYAARIDGSSEASQLLRDGVVPPGGYVALGDVRDEALPAHIDYSYGDGLKRGLNNEQGLVGLRCGDVVVDEVKYTQTARNGRSLQVDGAKQADSAMNDDTANWCEADAEYEAGAFGSPGEPNPPCITSGGVDCVDPLTQQRRTTVAPQVGDLVITELMANPSAVPDADGEWVEVFATRAVDLNGVTFSSGSSESALLSQNCLAIPEGGYALLARKDDPLLNGGLPAVLATFSVNLANSGGSVSLKLGDTVLDALTYSAVTDGASTQLDAERVSVDGNDDPAAFCVANSVYGAGVDRGTPGAPNASCETPIDPPVGDTCSDPQSGELRAKVAPQVGDLVISEFMANPEAVADTQGEWVEVYVKTAVDLNGLELGNEAGFAPALTSSTCLRAEAGAYLVFGRNGDSAQNGGLPPLTGTFSFNLANGGARSIVLRRAGTVLDQVSYSAVTAGKSSQLDRDQLDAGANDDPANFCAATGSYGAGDLGSPGAKNDACP